MTTGNFLTRNQDTEFHFMVDIETLDIGNNAAITEIGAVSRQADGTNEFFHVHCVDTEGTYSQEILDWRRQNSLFWATPDDVGDSVVDVDLALTRFFIWIEENAAGRRPVLWCKGTDFDAVILSNAANRNGITQLPWKYNDINDIRTLLRLWPQFKVPKELVKHNGLEDAIMQWTYLEKIADHVARLENTLLVKPGTQQ